jgi:hypothetical protein
MGGMDFANMGLGGEGAGDDDDDDDDDDDLPDLEEIE